MSNDRLLVRTPRRFLEKVGRWHGGNRTTLSIWPGDDLYIFTPLVAAVALGIVSYILYLIRQDVAISQSPPATTRPPADNDLEERIRRARRIQETDPDPLTSRRAVAHRLAAEAARRAETGDRTGLMGSLQDLHHVLGELAGMEEDHGQGIERGMVIDALMRNPRLVDLAAMEILDWYPTANYSHLENNPRRGGNLRAIAQASIDFLQNPHGAKGPRAAEIRQRLDLHMSRTPEHALNNEQIDGYARLREKNSR